MRSIEILSSFDGKEMGFFHTFNTFTAQVYIFKNKTKSADLHYDFIYLVNEQQ